MSAYNSNSKAAPAPAEPRTAVELLTNRLAKLGISHLFAIADQHSGLQQALAASPQQHYYELPCISALMQMAIGFCRESKQVTAAILPANTECGQALSAVQAAYEENLPLLILSLQQGSNETALYLEDQLNTVDLFQGLCRFNSSIEHNRQLQSKLLAAVHHAQHPVPGPVHLYLPHSLLQSDATLANDLTQGWRLPPGKDPSPDSNVMAELKYLLDNSRHGVVVIGQGCEAAIEDILLFAENKQWPIVTTPKARGLVSSYHPLYQGVYGLAGHESARQAVDNPQNDCLLVIASTLDKSTFCNWRPSAILDDRLIHIASNPDYLSRSYMGQLNVLADPRQVFQQLNRSYLAMPQLVETESFCAMDQTSPGNKVSLLHINDCLTDSEPMNPRRLFWYLSQHVPADLQLFTEAGDCSDFAIHYWHQAYHENSKTINRFHLGNIQAGVMYQALGCLQANPNNMVLAICQHNAFINQIHALSIARTMGLPLLTVVLTATQQPSHQVNIRQLCQSFGVPAQQISRIEQLSDADAWSLLKQPMVLDVAVDASVRPPTGLQRQYQGSTAVPVADDRDS